MHKLHELRINPKTNRTGFEMRILIELLLIAIAFLAGIAIGVECSEDGGDLE